MRITFIMDPVITFIFSLQKNEWIVRQDPEMCTRSLDLYAKASQPSNNLLLRWMLLRTWVKMNTLTL